MMAPPRIQVRTTGWSNQRAVEAVTEITVGEGGFFPWASAEDTTAVTQPDTLRAV